LLTHQVPQLLVLVLLKLQRSLAEQGLLRNNNRQSMGYVGQMSDMQNCLVGLGGMSSHSHMGAIILQATC
jgi:hypothetical protein